MDANKNGYYLLSVHSSDLMLGSFDEKFKTKEEAVAKMNEYKEKFKSDFYAIIRFCQDVKEVSQEIKYPKKKKRDNE